MQLKNEFERNTRRAEQGHIRMTQDTAPLYGPRKDFFISRACYLYNQIAAYNLPQKKTDYLLRIRGELDEYKKALRMKMYTYYLN